MIHVVTSAVVLGETGRVWLMRRTAACRDEHGRWDGISGLLDEGWTAEDNVRRELREECGAAPLSLSAIGWHEVFRPGNPVAPHTIRLDFIARVQEGHLAIAEPLKFDASGWFPLSALPSPPHSQLRAQLRQPQVLRAARELAGALPAAGTGARPQE